MSENLIYIHYHYCVTIYYLYVFSYLQYKNYKKITKPIFFHLKWVQWYT